MRQRTVIYVAGYGRSGSTVLGMLLGRHPRIANCGELGMLLEPGYRISGNCSCGCLLPGCPVWGPIVENLDAQDGQLDLAPIARRMECAAPMRPRNDTAGKYRDVNRWLLASIPVPDSVTHVVDSSKSAYRFAQRARSLRDDCDIDVRVIHLFRHPARVLESALRGTNRDLAAGTARRRPMETLLTLTGWAIANFAAARIALRFGAERALCIDFDELLVRPRAVLQRVGGLLELDLEEIIVHVERGRRIPVGHVVAGNRVASGNEAPPLTPLPANAPAIGFWRRALAGLVAMLMHRCLQHRQIQQC